MNLRGKLTGAILSTVLLAFVSCATDDAARAGAMDAGAIQAGAGADFSFVMNRDWMLVEVRTGGQVVTLNRDGFAALMGFSDLFTLRFEDGEHGLMAFGRAAPNLYSGPFAQGANQDLSFGMMRSTMMAALFELEELREHEFFAHLHNTTAWNIVGGNLELRATADGAETVLVFAEDR